MRTSRHGLTLGQRGWYRRVGGRLRWICSTRAAPTVESADRIFEERFAELARPRAPVAAATVEYLVDLWIDRQRERVAAGSLGHRTLGDYIDATNRLADALGDRTIASRLGPADFRRLGAAIESHSPGRRAKITVIIRALFRWAADHGHCAMPDFGPDFRPPRRAEFRRHKAGMGSRMYTAAQVGLLLRAATPQMRAMVLLALNGGLGNTDVAHLPWAALDLNRALCVYPRGKTGIQRTIPLWPETVAALAALPRGERVFAGDDGRPLISEAGTSHRDQIAVAFARLCEVAGVPNLGFYSLRRTHRTLADDVGDQRAAAAIMGHEVGDVGGIYVQHIRPERLRAVTDAVRRALAAGLGVAARRAGVAGAAATARAPAARARRRGRAG